MRTLIRLKVDDSKDWLEAWEESLTNYISLLKEIDQMKQSDRPFIENFKKLLEIERVNSPIDIPSSVLFALVEKRASMMNGVEVIDHNLNCSVTLKVEKLEVKLQLYSDKHVLVRDNEPYLHKPYLRVVHSDFVKAYAIPYSEYKSGKITKNQMRKRFMYIQREFKEKKGQKASKLKTFIDSILDVYFGKLYDIADILDEALEQIEEAPIYEAQCREVERKNLERESERIRILKESGLMDLLIEMRDNNVSITEDGSVRGLKWIR